MTNGDGHMGKSLKRDVENKLYAPVGAWLAFSDGFICTLDKNDIKNYIKCVISHVRTLERRA